MYIWLHCQCGRPRLAVPVLLLASLFPSLRGGAGGGLVSGGGANGKRASLSQITQGGGGRASGGPCKRTRAPFSPPPFTSGQGPPDPPRRTGGVSGLETERLIKARYSPPNPNAKMTCENCSRCLSRTEPGACPVVSGSPPNPPGLCSLGMVPDGLGDFITNRMHSGGQRHALGVNL